MKHLKILFLCLFLIGGANFKCSAVSLPKTSFCIDSAATNKPANCPCDRKSKRAKKKNGKDRTKAGRVLFDIAAVVKDSKEVLTLILLILK
jgi:hypothetical protein